MNRLLSPASGAASAHKYKSLSGVRELDTARPATTAVATGARRASDVDTWEGGEAGTCPCNFCRLGTNSAAVIADDRGTKS